EKSLLLLLDEGDNAFHPQWKKQYVSYCRTIIPLIFPGYTIQILITTHDPLTLSDLAKNNVIFLERREWGTVIGDSSGKRTLAANVSDMMKYSFFLSDGQIGNYIANIIDAILNELHIHQQPQLDATTIEYIQRVIHALDEPVLKFKLAEMFS